MAQNLKETAHLKTDIKKFSEGWDNIDWSKSKNKEILKCGFCETENDSVINCIDPYAEQIHGEKNHENFCPACLDKAYDEI